MDKKVVYERAVWNPEHTKLLEKEIRWDDGSRHLEIYATTSEGYGGYGENDEIKLFVNEDQLEGLAEYGVSWYELCGYYSVSLRTSSEKDARKLFKTLQRVTGYDAT